MVGHGHAALSYFPAPLDDELIYSTVARYHYSVGNAGGTQTKQRLFGTFSIPTVLPGYLDAFVAGLPAGCLTAPYVIERHTLFPYFAPFLSRACADRTLARMRDSDGLAVKLGLGLVGSRIKDVRYLRLCLDCLAHQRAAGGPLYWQRVHQLPGVDICPIHGSRLVDRCVACGPFDHRLAALKLPQQPCVCGGELRAPDMYTDGGLVQALTKFAHFSADLLRTQLPVLPPRARTGAYANALTAIGLKVKKGALAGEIADCVRAYWGDAFLAHLGLETKPFAMPRHLIHEVEATIHPVLHLLLIGVLFGDIATFAARLGVDGAAGVQQQGHADSELIQVLKASDYDVVAAAAAIGMSVWALATAARVEGIAVGRYFAHRDPRREMLMMEGIRAGAPIPEIAGVTGVSVETVYRRLKASPAAYVDRARALAGKLDSE